MQAIGHAAWTPPTAHAAPAGGDRPHVLVVDDERSLRETLAYNLRRSGFDVQTADDGPGALAAARTRQPSLILLDVLLPGGSDGFEICRQLRHEVRCPIILVSALADEVDRVVGLEVGADDYITKPFSVVELLARVKAHLRRAEMSGASLPAEERVAPMHPPPLVAGQVEIDPARREVRIGNDRIHLKRREFDLLYYLARHQGITLSRSRLLDAVWSDALQGKGDTRTVDVHVHRLRERIEPDPAKPRYLHTVRGLGYSFKVVEAPRKPA